VEQQPIMSAFSANLQKTIEGFLTRYETRRSAILPVLHAIQDEAGYISEAAVEELHETYKLDRVQVKEVISFYDIYKDQPTRKFFIRFCDNFTCRMLGSSAAIARCEEIIGKLDAQLGQDGPFQLERFPCLGKCDGAPVMLVNKERLERVTVDRVDECLSKYAKLPG
jgi:NADH-quinone oxidoreductase subunit E